MPLQTDQEIEANRPDVLIKKKQEKTAFSLICLSPTRRTLQFKLAVTEKLSKYKDLEMEMKNGQGFFVCFSWMPNINCFGAAVGA